MKVSVLVLGLLCCGGAKAQYVREFIFFSPGSESPGIPQGTNSGFVPPPIYTPPGESGSQTVYGAGGGLELRLARQFGVGGEISGIVTSQQPSDSLGNFSVGPYVHLWKRDSNFDLYVTGGYSVIFRDFTANGYHIGGGLNYWFRERILRRAEPGYQQAAQHRLDMRLVPPPHVVGIAQLAELIILHHQRITAEGFEISGPNGFKQTGLLTVVETQTVRIDSPTRTISARALSGISGNHLYAPASSRLPDAERVPKH